MIQQIPGENLLHVGFDIAGICVLSNFSKVRASKATSVLSTLILLKKPLFSPQILGCRPESICFSQYQCLDISSLVQKLIQAFIWSHYIHYLITEKGQANGVWEIRNISAPVDNTDCLENTLCSVLFDREEIQFDLDVCMHFVCMRMNVYSSVPLWGNSTNSALTQPRQSDLSLLRHMKWCGQSSHKASRFISDRLWLAYFTKR